MGYMTDHQGKPEKIRSLFVIVPIAVFIAVSLVVLMSPKSLTSFRDYDEIAVYHTRAAWVSEPGLPFSDAHPQEYPPGAVFFLALPRLLSDDIGSYHAAFSALMIIIFAALVITTAKSIVARKKNLALLHFFLLPGFLFFSVWRFDTLPALFAALGVLMVLRQRWGAAIISFVLGALTKGYPAIFLIPLFMLIGSRKMTPDTIRTLTRGFGIAAIGGVVLMGVAVVSGIFPDLVSPVLFHVQREFEIGALGSAIFWPETTTAMRSTIPYKFISLAFPAIQVMVVLTIILRGKISDNAAFLRTCILLLIPFLLFGRFSSPQWIIWLTPLLILVGSPFELAILALLDVTMFVQFPLLFGLDPYGGALAAAVLLKSSLMIILLFVSLKSLIRTKSLILKRVGKSTPMESQLPI